MSETSEPGSEAGARDSGSGSVGDLELFFDLVFVYAMAQLTELVRDDVSWRGFGHGVLGLLAVWWAWVCYTWLTNTFTTNRVVFRCLVIAAMAAMLLTASALPTAFSTGALVFGLALLTIRVIHLVLFVVAVSHDDEHLRAGLLRLVPSLLIAPVMIAVAAAFPSPYRELLWIGAAIIDFGGPLVAGVEVLRVVPSYFVERHGNIIIALGEAVVGLGTGASEHLQQPVVLAAAVLGVLIAASLWWTYFGLTAGASNASETPTGPNAPDWPATPTATSTFPWSPGSPSSASAPARRSSTCPTPYRCCRRSPSVAGWACSTPPMPPTDGAITISSCRTASSRRPHPCSSSRQH